MTKSHTITQEIKVLRTGAPWSGAVILGIAYGLFPWFAHFALTTSWPSSFLFLILVWIVQACLSLIHI